MQLLPTVERLRHALAYDPESGRLTWRNPPGLKVKAGAVVGSKTKRGFIQMRLDEVTMKVHRVVWALHFGAWPADTIDHINGDKTDNRLVNLRVASNRVQNENRRAALKNNSTGLLGVRRCRAAGRFMAGIQVGGRHIHLGTFSDAQAAHAAYVAAKRELHEGCTL